MTKRPPKPTDRPSSHRYKSRKAHKTPGETPELTLRKLILLRPTEEDREASWTEIREHGPRASAIVSSAFTEDAVRYAVLTKLVTHLIDSDLENLLDQRGPMGTFFSSIELGYALG